MFQEMQKGHIKKKKNVPRNDTREYRKYNKRHFRFILVSAGSRMLESQRQSRHTHAVPHQTQTGRCQSPQLWSHKLCHTPVSCTPGRWPKHRDVKMSETRLHHSDPDLKSALLSHSVSQSTTQGGRSPRAWPGRALCTAQRPCASPAPAGRGSSRTVSV